MSEISMDERIQLAAGLIYRRAAWICTLTSELLSRANRDLEAEKAFEHLQYAVLDLDEVFDEFAAEPDAKWRRDCYLMLGVHAVLTEDGWLEADDAEAGAKILDEVNAPGKESTKR